MTDLADSVSQLPTDENYTNSPEELKILQKYFENPEESKKLLSELKEVLIGAVVFALLANPATDFLLGYVPHMGSPLIKFVGTIVIFIVIFYVGLIVFKK